MASKQQKITKSNVSAVKKGKLSCMVDICDNMLYWILAYCFNGGNSCLYH